MLHRLWIFEPVSVNAQEWRIPRENPSRTQVKSTQKHAQSPQPKSWKFFPARAIPTLVCTKLPVENTGKCCVLRLITICCSSASHLQPAQRFSVTVQADTFLLLTPRRCVHFSQEHRCTGPLPPGAFLTTCPVGLRLAMGRAKNSKPRLGSVRGLHSEGCNIEGDPQK